VRGDATGRGARGAGAGGGALVSAGAASEAGGSLRRARSHIEITTRIAITLANARRRPRRDERRGRSEGLRRLDYLVTVQVTVCCDRGQAVRLQYWRVTDVGHTPVVFRTQSVVALS